MIFFSIRSLKYHLPLLDDIITVRLLAKIPGNFARKDGDWLERLGVLVNIMVESPLEAARTLPRFNGVVGV